VFDAKQKKAFQLGKREVERKSKGRRKGRKSVTARKTGSKRENNPWERRKDNVIMPGKCRV